MFLGNTVLQVLKHFGGIFRGANIVIPITDPTNIKNGK